MDIYKELYEDLSIKAQNLGGIIGKAQSMVFALRLELKYKTSNMSEEEYRIAMAAKCEEIYEAMQEGLEKVLINYPKSKIKDNE